MKTTVRQRVVLLIDICSFSSMEIERQFAAVLDLQKLCVRLMSRRKSQFIEMIPLGDGFIFGLTGQNLVEAILFCIAVQKAVQSKSRRPYQIRSAINYGNVFEYIDINSNPNFIGDAVNVCARISNGSNPDSIILRDTYYNLIREIDHELSSKILKYGVPVFGKRDEEYSVYYYVDEKNKVGNRVPYGRRIR